MIELASESGVAVLTMNRPKVNAIDGDFVEELSERVREVQRSVEWGALVLASGLEGIYCGGLDLKALSAMSRSEFAFFFEQFELMMRLLASGPVVTIAAVDGHAVAGGAVLALACDRRVAGNGDYRFGMTEIELGLPLTPMLAMLLTERVGLGASMEIGLTGKLFSMMEASKLGVVDSLVSQGDALETALEMGAALASKSRRPFRAMGAQLRAGFLERLEQKCNDEKVRDEFVDFWFSEECVGKRKAILAKLASKGRG